MQVGWEAHANPELNKFQFVCPVFNSKVDAADCFQLDMDYMRGHPHKERAGCNACMSAGKCPIRRMVKDQASGRYFSDEQKLGQIPKEIREGIAPLKVLQSTLDHYGVDTEERAIIIGSVVATQTGASRVRSLVRESAQRRQVAAEQPEETPTDSIVAGPNDMAAVITAAVKAESKKPAENDGWGDDPPKHPPACPPVSPWKQETYSEPELASIKEHKLEAQKKAHEAAKAAGVTIDPRIEAAKRKPTLLEIALQMKASKP